MKLLIRSFLYKIRRDVLHETHGTVQHTGDFDAPILNSVDDGMPTGEADAAIRMDISPLSPAPWRSHDACERVPDLGHVAISLFRAPMLQRVGVDSFHVAQGELGDSEFHRSGGAPFGHPFQELLTV